MNTCHSKTGSRNSGEVKLHNVNYGILILYLGMGMGIGMKTSGDGMGMGISERKTLRGERFKNSVNVSILYRATDIKCMGTGQAVQPVSH